MRTTHRSCGGILFVLLRILAVGILGFMLAAVAVLSLMKKKGQEVIFAPLSAHQGNWDVAKYGGFEECQFAGSDNSSLSGWFFPAKERGQEWVILWCPPTVGNISLLFDQARLLQKAGCSVFLFDYRGFGKSNGVPSETGCYQDAQAAYNYLIDKKSVLPKKIVVLGQSLGGCVALYLASQYSNVRAVIIESTPFSVQHLLKDSGLNIAASFLPAQFPAGYWVTKISTPLLIVHGQKDKIVPVSCAEGLNKSCKSRKHELYLIPDGGHINSYQMEGIAYFKKVHNFVATCGE